MILRHYTCSGSKLQLSVFEESCCRWPLNCTLLFRLFPVAIMLFILNKRDVEFREMIFRNNCRRNKESSELQAFAYFNSARCTCLPNVAVKSLWKWKSQPFYQFLNEYLRKSWIDLLYSDIFKIRITNIQFRSLRKKRWLKDNCKVFRFSSKRNNEIKQKNTITTLQQIFSCRFSLVISNLWLK